MQILYLISYTLSVPKNRQKFDAFFEFLSAIDWQGKYFTKVWIEIFSQLIVSCRTILKSRYKTQSCSTIKKMSSFNTLKLRVLRLHVITYIQRKWTKIFTGFDIWSFLTNDISDSATFTTVTIHQEYAKVEDK